MLRMRASLVAVLMLLSACASAAPADIQVVSPWVREVPPVSQNSAAFFTVHNSGKSGDELLSVETPAAASVEMHEMDMQGGVMHMRQLLKVPVPAGGEVVFSPGGRHVMLFDLKAPLKTGAQVSLVLHFRKAGAVRVLAPVKPDPDQ